MNSMMAAVVACMAVPGFCYAEAWVHATHGTVKFVRTGGSALVMTAADGTKYTVHAAKRTALYGFEGVSNGTRGAFYGLTAGSEVVVHYTVAGSRLTAVSVRKVGAVGLTATEGTLQAIDQGRGTVALKTSDGSVKTYTLAEHATASATKAASKSITVGSKAVVYSTEAAGKRIAHLVRAL